MIRTDWLLEQLDLPEGTWPVSHRTLLGFPDDTRIDIEEVERRVVERMNRLRVHQLREPDTVTEGMNRLAAAMVALTAPNRVQIPVPIPVPIAPPVPIQVPISSASQVYSLAPLIPPSPIGIAPMVAVESEVVVPGEVEPAVTTRPQRRARTRREWYVRIAELRRPLEPLATMRIWAISRFDAENRTVSNPAFVEAVNQMRVLLPQYADLIGGRGRPGERVAAILRSEADGRELRRRFQAESAEIVDELREMQFSLEREMATIRERLNYGRDRTFSRRWIGPVLRRCLRYPEIVCAAIGTLALAIAFRRI